MDVPGAAGCCQPSVWGPQACLVQASKQGEKPDSTENKQALLGRTLARQPHAKAPAGIPGCQQALKASKVSGEENSTQGPGQERHVLKTFLTHVHISQLSHRLLSSPSPWRHMMRRQIVLSAWNHLLCQVLEQRTSQT